MSQICYQWGNASVPWSNGNWLWSQCFNQPTPITEVIVPSGVDATTIIQPWQAEEQWNPYRAGEFDNKKRLIQLICKVQGEVFKEEKEAGDMKISVDDVIMKVKDTTDINLNVKLEE